jgi:hypothetical protein
MKYKGRKLISNWGEGYSGQGDSLMSGEREGAYRF